MKKLATILSVIQQAATAAAELDPAVAPEAEAAAALLGLVEQLLPHAQALTAAAKAPGK